MKFNKIKIRASYIILLLSLFTFIAPHVNAHELIPQELIEYVQNNPDASAEEIKKFAENQNPKFAKKFRDGEEILKLVRQNETSFIDNMYDFFVLGLKHILSGLDHILFVISLLLIFMSWKDILKITGTFTVAHSITLILAGAGILVLSPSIVEPIIALSIAYVAVTTVFLKKYTFLTGNKSKIITVFLFGLFHGLGFAGLLKEIQIPQDKFISSLISFNLGIEGGQLLIVALAFPFIYFLSKKPYYQNIIKILAGLIIAIALFWFFQRIF